MTPLLSKHITDHSYPLALQSCLTPALFLPLALCPYQSPSLESLPFPELHRLGFLPSFL